MEKFRGAFDSVFPKTTPISYLIPYQHLVIITKETNFKKTASAPKATWCDTLPQEPRHPAPPCGTLKLG
jgi:hypothetical protein